MATGGGGENSNPAYEAFRKHFAELQTVIQDPGVLAGKLYSEDIITADERKAACYYLHDGSMRSSNLLSAVESKIKVDPEKFDVFLSTLAKEPSMSKLCRRMKDTYESNPPSCQCPQENETNLLAKMMVAQDRRETESNDCSIRRWNLVKCLLALIALIVLIAVISYTYQSVKHSLSKNFTLYADKVKQRYKKHLDDVAQSSWLPANRHTFIQLSLTSQDKPRAARVDQYSANQRIDSERSMTFDDLLSEIDASPGTRILVVGQPGIGKTTLLQMITRYWAHDRALSSCWILLHIVLRDLVLLQHAPNLTTFLSFMGSITLPPDIETFVLESDGKGLCFIADGLDEYQAGYKDEIDFIFSELIGAQKPNIKLAQSTVVISSRPEVASQVWHLFNKRVEVLGFGDDQIGEYIQATEYHEDKSFLKYLDDHPHIKHTCYIPLHLPMLVYLKDYLLGDKTVCLKLRQKFMNGLLFTH